MSTLRGKQAERAAFNRDFIWTLLWSMPDGNWVSSRAVYEAWLDGRSECGIAFVDDFIGPAQYFTQILNRLCTDGRAEMRREPGRHPRYRAVGP